MGGKNKTRLRGPKGREENHIPVKKEGKRKKVCMFDAFATVVHSTILPQVAVVLQMLQEKGVDVTF